MRRLSCLGACQGGVTAVMSRMRRFWQDSGGAALAEAAIVLPLMLIVTLGMFQFGILLNEELLVANAAAAGGRQASVSRGDANAYTNITAAVAAGAANLTAGSLTTYICVNTTGSTPSCAATNACTSNAVCYADFNSDQGLQVTVKVSYACTSLFNFGTTSWSFLNATVCPIRTQVTEIIQ